jgi:hypothetical protein
VAVAFALGEAGSAEPRDGLIAFQRPGTAPDTAAIWAAHVDGRGLRRLIPGQARAFDADPDWSPDGATVVFSRSTGRKAPKGRVTTIDARSGGMLDIWPASTWSSFPTGVALSPDGGQALVAFGCRYGGCVAGTQWLGLGARWLGIARARGGALRRVVPVGLDLTVLPLSQGAWAPSAGRIAYTRKGRLCTAGLAGSGERCLPWRVSAGRPDWGTRP